MSDSPPDLTRLAEALAEPFDPSEVKWKPQSVVGNRALVIAFVDARVIQDRLDEVLGVMGWQDSYDCLPDGTVLCRLRVRIGNEWVTKEDVGGQSEQPDEGDRRKAAFSDALKRAAVKFGLGRYLYRLKAQWVDYDPQKKRLTGKPVLPPEALPRPEPVQARVARFEARLVDAGRCSPGALTTWLADHYCTTWPNAPAAEVERACKEFEALARTARP